MLYAEILWPFRSPSSTRTVTFHWHEQFRGRSLASKLRRITSRLPLCSSASSRSNNHNYAVLRQMQVRAGFFGNAVASLGFVDGLGQSPTQRREIQLPIAGAGGSPVARKHLQRSSKGDIRIIFYLQLQILQSVSCGPSTLRPSGTSENETDR